MHEPIWIRWYMIAFFTLFGGWSVLKRARFGRANGWFCATSVVEPERSRLIAAIRARASREELPSVAMGGTLGAVSLGLAAVAASTHVPVAILYAALTFALAVILVVGYARVRYAQRRRVASLHARDRDAVVPGSIRALVAAGVVMPLCWLPDAPLAASLVTAAGLAIGGLALRVEAMPAYLAGDDLAVETFVDARLRAARVVNLFATAAAPGFVFASFIGWIDSYGHVAAFAVSLTAVGTATVRQKRLCRPPTDSDVAMWAHAAS